MRSLAANFLLALLLFAGVVVHALSTQRDEVDGLAAAQGVTAPMAQETAAPSSAPAATSSSPQIDAPTAAPASGS